MPSWNSYSSISTLPIIQSDSVKKDTCCDPVTELFQQQAMLNELIKKVGAKDTIEYPSYKRTMRSNKTTKKPKK